MIWKQKVILFLLLLLVAASGLLVSGKPASPQLDTLKITVLGSSAPRSHVPLLFDNRGGGAIVIWEPCRIERKETGRVTVGGTRVQALPVAGTNVFKAPDVQIIVVELTGTNYGPWRVLVPVARYDLIARMETLLGKRVGTLIRNSRGLESIMRHSGKWVASDWFDEPVSPFFGAYGKPPSTFRPGIPGPPRWSGSSTSFAGSRPSPPDYGAPPGGPSMGPWPRGIDLGHGMASDSQSLHEDSQTLFFVLRHFHTRYKRWPTNATEVKLFAATKAYLQPEIPSRYNESWFEDTVFTTNPAEV